MTSIHSMGLAEAARFLTAGKAAPPITVLGVEPERLDYGMVLSGAVQAVLPRVVTLARETVAGWMKAES
jgi:hydrogenase maturation protease